MIKRPIKQLKNNSTLYIYISENEKRIKSKLYQNNFKYFYTLYIFF